MAASEGSCEVRDARCEVCELSLAFRKLSLEAGAEDGVDSEGARGARDEQGGLMEGLRGLLLETMAGREGGNLGPPLRIVVRAVETRTVTPGRWWVGDSATSPGLWRRRR